MTLAARVAKTGARRPQLREWEFPMTKRSALAILAASVAGLVAAAAPADAAYPGVNGRVAFTRFSFDPLIGYYGDNIWAANPDGTQQRQLTHLPYGAYVTDWSPDGRRVLFDYGDADGNAHVATVNADGTGLHSLTSGGFIQADASYTPDGAHILYDVAPANAPGWHISLWEMNADGTGQHLLLANPPNISDYEPRMSPDGRLIEFTRIRKDMGIDDKNQQNAVFVMHADGSDLRQLTAYGKGTAHADWSPDGRRIVYSDGSLTFPTSATLYTVRPDGTDRQKLLQLTGDRDAYRPRYSPDGRRILFGCATQNPKTRDGDVCTMDADGTNIINITNTPFYKDGSGYELPFAWGTAPLL